MPSACAHSAQVAAVSSGVYSVPSSVACVSASARGRDECSSCGVTASASTASGVSLACGVSAVSSLAPPLKNSGAPHSSTLMCAIAWQTIASVLRQIARQRQRVGRRAVEHEEHVAVGLEQRRGSRRVAAAVQSSAP